jgi:hypothetical protein
VQHSAPRALTFCANHSLATKRFNVRSHTGGEMKTFPHIVENHVLPRLGTVFDGRPAGLMRKGEEKGARGSPLSATRGKFIQNSKHSFVHSFTHSQQTPTTPQTHTPTRKTAHGATKTTTKVGCSTEQWDGRTIAPCHWASE